MQRLKSISNLANDLHANCVAKISLKLSNIINCMWRMSDAERNFSNSITYTPV